MAALNETEYAPGSREQIAPASRIVLYPLRFEPIYQYRLWGGRRLASLLNMALPGDAPIGEAWVLSDRPDHPSHVVDGPLKGWTLEQLLKHAPEDLMGRLASRFQRFPLLLKFLDASSMLSVQVHPADSQTELLPEGESGKTEAWVVLEAAPESRIYAGLKPGATEERLQRAIANRTLPDELASFTPLPGDAIFLRAGTVHSLGGGIVVFEVQENSDVTFRLDDWNRVDIATGTARPLQIEQALASIDFTQGQVGPVTPQVEETAPVLRERLFQCEHFELRRIRGKTPLSVGAAGMPTVLVGIEGEGEIERGGARYSISKGEVMLLPAVLGACAYRPRGSVCLLEVALPALQ